MKVYGIINAVDGDGLASNNDKWNSISATITEQAPVGITSVAGNKIEMLAFPNPVSTNLSLQLNNAQAGTYNVRVYDMSGKVMTAQSVEVSGNAAAGVIDMHSLAAGMYHVSVEKDGMVTTQSVIKK